MKFLQLLKLSHADFVTRRKTITFSVLAVSIPFIILLLINLLAAGTERVLLHETSKVTGGSVYLAISSSNPKRELETAFANGGELVTQITKEQVEEYDNTVDLIKDIPGITVNDHLLNRIKDSNSFSIEFMQLDDTLGIFKDLHATDIFLTSIAPYYAPLYSLDSLQRDLESKQIYIIRFPSAKAAYASYKTSCFRSSSCNYIELIDNVYGSYVRMHSNHDFTYLLQIAFMIIAAIIAIGTYVYLLDQSMQSMVIYRALGANTIDLVTIALGFIIEVSLTVIIFSLTVALLLALIVSGIDARYVTELFTNFYGYAPDNTILIGFSLQIIWIILTIFLTAPLSLMLTLDHFSTKQLSRKLKRD